MVPAEERLARPVDRPEKLALATRGRCQSSKTVRHRCLNANHAPAPPQRRSVQRMDFGHKGSADWQDAGRFSGPHSSCARSRFAARVEG